MNKSQLLATCLLIVIALTVVPSAFAATPSPTGLPGFGYGDPNHVHVGPPGISDRIHDRIEAILQFRADIIDAVRDFLHNLFHPH